jgi:hypothetical protein
VLPSSNNSSSVGSAITPRCSFCGTSTGPFHQVEGLFTVLMCASCQVARRSSPDVAWPMTRAEMPDRPAVLLAGYHPGEPWLKWACPVEGCTYREILPWGLEAHAAVEHAGWFAEWQAEGFRVVFRRVEGPTAS